MLAKTAARGDPLPSDVFFHVIGTPMVRNSKASKSQKTSKEKRIVNLIIIED
jgi:hypothetical protein